MNYRRYQKSDYFFVIKVRQGRYRACVDLYPGTKGKHRYCRDAASRAKGEELLLCLQRELVTYPGPVAPTLEAWYKGILCKDVPTLKGCWCR